jgi:hypothetical protein
MIGNKQGAEAVGSRKRAVGERSCRLRSGPETVRGAAGSEYAGLSNDKAGENPARRKPKVSWGR